MSYYKCNAISAKEKKGEEVIYLTVAPNNVIPYHFERIRMTNIGDEAFKDVLKDFDDGNIQPYPSLNNKITLSYKWIEVLDREMKKEGNDMVLFYLNELVEEDQDGRLKPSFKSYREYLEYIMERDKDYIKKNENGLYPNVRWVLISFMSNLNKIGKNMEHLKTIVRYNQMRKEAFIQIARNGINNEKKYEIKDGGRGVRVYTSGRISFTDNYLYSQRELIDLMNRFSFEDNCLRIYLEDEEIPLKDFIMGVIPEENGVENFYDEIKEIQKEEYEELEEDEYEEISEYIEEGKLDELLVYFDENNM